MNDYFNVRSFGATGDGATNDAAKIQAAINALPAGGGIVYFPPGTYKITSTLTLPDKDVTIEFASGSKVTISGAISAFTVPDGLTAVRLYQIIGRPIFQGDPASAQTLFTLNDANGRGNFDLRNAVVTGIATFTDWLKYDESYLNQSNIRVYGSSFEPVAGGSTLAKTPQVANSYFAPVAIRFVDSLLRYVVSANVIYGWTGDADCDLWFQQCPQVRIQAGCKFDGLVAVASFLSFIGSGDYTFNGNAYEVYDFVDGQTIVIGSGSGLVFSWADARLIFGSSNAKIHPAQLSNCAVKLIGPLSTLQCAIMTDGLGLSNPGVELINSGSAVEQTHFRKISAPATVFPQGCIKITGASFCKIHDNDFATTITGKTIFETGAADKNIIHACTGIDSGTGFDIPGANSIVGADNIG